MTNEQQEGLRKSCLTLLANSNLTMSSRKGKEAAFSFWVGALSAYKTLGVEAGAYVSICLMSGRIDDLMKEPS